MVRLTLGIFTSFAFNVFFRATCLKQLSIPGIHSYVASYDVPAPSGGGEYQLKDIQAQSYSHYAQPALSGRGGGRGEYQLKDIQAQSYSQYAQDLILWPILKNIQNGFFLESGAMDGESLSDTLLYELHGWTGLLVEPDPGECEKILHKNRNANVYCGGLSPVPKTTQVRYIPGSKGAGNGYILPNSGHTWANILHASVDTKTGNELMVNTKTVAELLLPMGHKTVDFWSLDTEGSEAAIISSTDFKSIEFGVISTAQNPSQVEQILTAQGFKLIGGIYHSEVGLESASMYSKWRPSDFVYVNPAYFNKRSLRVPTNEDLKRASEITFCTGICPNWRHEMEGW